jgi:hypothetical protein
MKQSKNIFIRVGEKNNFNHQNAEFSKLKGFEKLGKIFLNSNSFTDIKSNYPAIVTINPYLIFNPLSEKSDLKNIKAFRIKVFCSNNPYYMQQQRDCFAYAKRLNIPVLVTFFRARSKKTAEKFNLQLSNYEYKGNYFRLTEASKKVHISNIIAFSGLKKGLINFCDLSGNGCPSCNNCTRLTYNKIGTIKALNLSISGVNDKNNKRGICPFNCPDCWAKIVTFKKSPACDKLIDNKKITGNLNNKRGK